MSRINPVEAFYILQESMIGAEAIAERKAQLAEYTSNVLREKGGLLIARSGMFGGTPGLMGSADPGVLLRQATEPVRLDGAYVALRDKDEERSDKIELLFLESEDDSQVGEVGDESVAAVLSHGTLELPNTDSPTKDQIDSVESVVGHIENSLPLPENISPVPLPRIARFFDVDAGVHSIQVLRRGI